MCAKVGCQCSRRGHRYWQAAGLQLEVATGSLPRVSGLVTVALAAPTESGTSESPCAALAVIMMVATGSGGIQLPIHEFLTDPAAASGPRSVFKFSAA
jgi:hypothetical protein